MATRDGTRTRTKLKDSGDADETVLPAGQQKRPEMAQFRLQVDRQTKSSYATYEAAEAAALVIKREHPIVRVSVFDSVAGESTVIEVPVEQSK
jgi:hypothetical protein